MNEHFRVFFSAAVAALLFGTWVGCGTGEYERRLEANVKQRRQESAAGQMSPAAAVPGTPIKIQFPSATETVSWGASPLPAETDPRRLKAPQIASGAILPDLRATYEGKVNYGQGDAAGKMSFYCYVAAGDASSYGSRDPKTNLLVRATNLFPGTTLQIQDVECKSGSGLSTTWGRFRGTREGEFYHEDAAGNQDFRKLAAVLEFYCCRQGNQWIVILWRVPEMYEASIELAKWGPLVAGGVTVN